jgi:glycosyltransferase involved in cell wall biosynthesis
VNGLFYDYGDVPTLAEKIDRLLSDDALRKKLGRQAIDWARQWTWDGAAGAMEGIIRQAIEEHGKSRG